MSAPDANSPTGSPLGMSEFLVAETDAAHERLEEPTGGVEDDATPGLPGTGWYAPKVQINEDLWGPQIFKIPIAT